METESILQALARHNLTPLRRFGGRAGLSEAYFVEIARSAGADPDWAIRLGRHWRAMLKTADRPEFVWRARAVVLRLQGRWLDSAEAFVQAGTVAGDPVDRLAFAIGAIDSLARGGDVDRAVDLGRRLERQLSTRSPAQAGRAGLNLANALIWQDRYREAFRVYERALKRLQTPVERAACHLGLATSALYTGRLDLAEAQGNLASESFSTLGLPFYEAQAHTTLARVDLLRGKPDLAWDRLRSIESWMTEIPDQARLQEFLGDTFMALNLYEQASERYSISTQQAKGMPLNRANGALGYARAQLALGREAEARNGFLRAARGYRASSNEVWRRTAEVELSRLNQDGPKLAVLAHELERLGAGYLAAEAALASAEFGQAAGLAHARKLIQRYRLGGLKWKLDWLNARSTGRISDYRRMAQGIIDDRLLARSLLARTTYLRDRGSALREFLRCLVMKDTPSTRREAVAWISRSRSAALVDEIIATDDFAPIRPKLISLRRDVAASEDAGPEGVRWSRQSRQTAHDVTLALLEPLDGKRAEAKFDAGLEHDTWLSLGDEFACVAPHQVRRVPAECINREVRWLLFEMMAPLTMRHAASDTVMESADDLRQWLGPSGPFICPDGVLWNVPWPVLLDEEPILCLSPQFNSGPHWRLPVNARVCVWGTTDISLPGAQAEVDILRAAFPDCVVCHTADQVRDSMQQHWDYVHVAAHARFDTSNPMFASFEFKDGAITAFEIARSPLRTELAVLAACETGRFETTLPDEPNGMARAFLARGADAVIAAQWPLDDEAACVTINRFVQELTQKRSVVDSLAAARQACRRSFEHPYFWGPLVLIAGYRDA